MMTNLVLGLYSVVARVAATGASWLMKRKGRWSEESIAQRYGGNLPEAIGDHPVWIHASSMGEVRVGATLARALAKRGVNILASAMTETGFEQLQGAYPEGTVAIRAPYDLASAVNQVLERFNPRALIVVETELWPNTLRAVTLRGIPIFIVNGRLSEKSYPKYRRTRWFWRSMLVGVNRFYMRSQIDADRIIGLGIDPSRVENSGSLKSTGDVEMSSDTYEMVGRILHPDRPIWIAGSTRPGEEEIIFAAHQTLQRRHPHLQLWIAPRHPERFDDVADIIMKMELPVARWSEVAAGSSPETDILLIDQMGILPELYGYARVAFVGGSLEPFGGHNPMEPAIHGVPVMFGPHMDTQRDSADWLTREHLATVVTNAEDIVTEVSRILDSPDSPGDRDRRVNVVKSQTLGAVERVADDIMRRLGVSRSS